ncbi:hypothetical protein B566_EDAN004201 [Ephemera danica]|nr:hypothetical protein B566_EDAN004201 [Ephemera danica]
MAEWLLIKQQVAQPIFFGNPAAFQYSGFPNSNFASNQSPAGTVFIPFQSRGQQSAPPRRDYYNPQPFPSPQPAVFQPAHNSRFNSFPQQQDRLAPPRQTHFVQESNFEPSSPNLYNREPPRSQVQVHFEHTPSIRLEAPTGRKLKTPEDYAFPRAPEIPRNVEQNLFESDFNSRRYTTTTTEKPTTTRQPSGLRRYKPGTRTQPGLRNNVLTVPKTEETTPRPQRTRTKSPDNNGNNGGRTRYRVVPTRFRTRPPLSILQEPPFENTTPIVPTSTRVYDFSKLTTEATTPKFRPSPPDQYDNSGPEVSHPAVAGFVPAPELSVPTGPSGPNPDYPAESHGESDYPSGSQSGSGPETNGTSDYPSGEDYPSNPEVELKSTALPETAPEIVPHEDIHIPEILAQHPGDSPTHNETFDVITMKSQSTLVKDDNFKGFVDSVLIDTAPTISSQKLDDETNTEETGTVSVSVHTAVSTVPRATTPSPDETQSESSIIEIPPTPEPKYVVTNSTESWVVVASVQTSRSVSGARFIPFNTGIKQEEKVVTSLKDKTTTLPPTTVNEKSVIAAETTTEKMAPSTESVHDMLDRVQSELSNSFLSANSPNAFVTVSPSTSTTVPSTTTTTSTTEAPLFERKFSPSRNTQNKNKSRVPQSILDSIQFDDLTTGLLPPGFKPRQGQNSFKNRPITTTTERTTSSRRAEVSSTTSTTAKPKINLDSLAPALLPPGFKLEPSSTEATAVKQDNAPRLPAFRPKIKHLPVPGSNTSRFSGAKSLNASTNTNVVTPQKVEKADNVPASLLPPGFKPKADAVPSSLLPPGSKPKADAVPSFLLPPGFKAEPEKIEPTGLLADILSKAKIADVSSLLPPGFKPEPVEVSALLPPGFTPSTESSASTTAKSHTVPRPGIGTRKPFGAARFTSPKPTVAGGGAAGAADPALSTPKISKGWPTSCPLRSVYEKSDALNKIFRKVWIDGFNKGSVLVDYIVQIDTSAARHLDTLELKRMFHESLRQAPPPTTTTSTTVAPQEDELVTSLGEQPAAHQAAEPPAKPRLQLGTFQLDPEYTDFVAAPNQGLMYGNCILQ